MAEGRQDRLLVRAGGDDNVGGVDLAPGGLEPESAVHRADAIHAHARPHGRVDELAVALDEGDHLVARGEAVRPVAAILLAGQAQAPVGELEHQRIPALVPPALGHPPPLEDDVGAPEPAQVIAEREPGVPAAHDHRLGRDRHYATRLRRCAGLVNLSAALRRGSPCAIRRFAPPLQSPVGLLAGNGPRAQPASGSSRPPPVPVGSDCTLSPSAGSTTPRAVAAGSGRRLTQPCARPRCGAGCERPAWSPQAPPRPPS